MEYFGCWTKLKKNLFITTERLYMREMFFVVPANRATCDLQPATYNPRPATCDLRIRPAVENRNKVYGCDWEEISVMSNRRVWNSSQ